MGFQTTHTHTHTHKHTHTHTAADDKVDSGPEYVNVDSLDEEGEGEGEEREGEREQEDGDERERDGDQEERVRLITLWYDMQNLPSCLKLQSFTSGKFVWLHFFSGQSAWRLLVGFTILTCITKRVADLQFSVPNHTSVNKSVWSMLTPPVPAVRLCACFFQTFTLPFRTLVMYRIASFFCQF